MHTTIDGDAGDQHARESSNPDHIDHDATDAAATGTDMPRQPANPRIAFYGRVVVNDGGNDASTSLALQYDRCRLAAPPDAITAVFYDIGTGRPQHRLPVPGRLPLPDGDRRRDGGLPELVTEAASPHRRFDYLIATGPDRLSRNTGRLFTLLRPLHAAGVTCLFPTGIRPARPDGIESAGPDWIGLVAIVDVDAWLNAWAQPEEGPRR